MCKQDKHLRFTRRFCSRLPAICLVARLTAGTEVVSPGGVKSMGEGGHLVQNASEGPNVGLVVVGLVVEKLGGHVVRRPDSRAGKVHRTLQHLTKNKCVSLERRLSCEAPVYQPGDQMRCFLFLCGIRLVFRHFKPG